MGHKRNEGRKRLNLLNIPSRQLVGINEDLEDSGFCF